MDNSLDSDGKKLRQLILTTVQSAGRGHIGPAFSILEILRALYGHVLIKAPLQPKNLERDVFILSKGHGVLALYVVLAEQGYFDKKELKEFCKFGSRLGGHPESGSLPGIEFSTGSLGHGLPVGVGIALAAKLSSLDQKRIYILVGDGELNEGSNWESMLHATKHKLNNLCLIVDYNKMQAFGHSGDVLPMFELGMKLSAFGFTVEEVSGHSIKDLTNILDFPVLGDKPRAVIAHTVKGKGINKLENSKEWHHKAKIQALEIQELLESIK